MRAGLVALALLGLGEAAPAALPVHVQIEVDRSQLRVTVDGAIHQVDAAYNGQWQTVSFEQPGPLEREYQIDGSDTTAARDRREQPLVSLLPTPYYKLFAWLRDESSFSRWERTRLIDLATGQQLAITTDLLPERFRIEADLRRPEAPAYLWLVTQDPRQREGLELDRDDRNARWVIDRAAGGVQVLPRWFFPEQPGPFAASLLHLVGRSVAAAYVLVLLALLLAAPVRRLPARRFQVPEAAGQLILAGWLLAAVLVAVRVYRQLPHVLDGVSYWFQAGVFASGALWLTAPPLESALRGPFQLVWQGRWFSQYPPGAAAAYALGRVVGLEWLVGPLACTAMIASTWWTAGALFGRRTGLVVLGIGVLSPFVLFQTGTFMSHPIAAGLLAAALAAFVAGERSARLRWFALSGALLGAAFLTREAASALFSLPLVARLIATRRGQPLGWLLAGGLPFSLPYFAYNAQLTGSPFLLPRTLFNAADRFGFGDNFGFHLRHTPAAGLVNTDELLTLLQFDLSGWPPLASFALLVVPFLFGRAQTWDCIAAGGFLAFVVAYAAYFYHGIALGPRYYFEALPWVLLLAGRGAQVLAQLSGSRAAVALLLGLLSVNTLMFYLPTQLERRADFAALPDGRRARLGFVSASLQGPQLTNVPTPALVMTDDWWTFNAMLSPLNCPRLTDCPVVFALAMGDNDVQRLLAAFPGRVNLRTVDHGGRIDIEPAVLHNR